MGLKTWNTLGYKYPSHPTSFHSEFLFAKEEFKHHGRFPGSFQKTCLAVFSGYLRQSTRKSSGFSQCSAERMKHRAATTCRTHQKLVDIITIFSKQLTNIANSPISWIAWVMPVRLWTVVDLVPHVRRWLRIRGAALAAWRSLMQWDVTATRLEKSKSVKVNESIHPCLQTDWSLSHVSRRKLHNAFWRWERTNDKIELKATNLPFGFNCDDVIRLRPALRGLSHGSVWETRQNLLSLRLLNNLQREKSCMNTRTLCLPRRL